MLHRWQRRRCWERGTLNEAVLVPIGVTMRAATVYERSMRKFSTASTRKLHHRCTPSCRTCCPAVADPIFLAVRTGAYTSSTRTSTLHYAIGDGGGEPREEPQQETTSRRDIRRAERRGGHSFPSVDGFVGWEVYVCGLYVTC